MSWDRCRDRQSANEIVEIVVQSEALGVTRVGPEPAEPARLDPSRGRGSWRLPRRDTACGRAFREPRRYPSARLTFHARAPSVTREIELRTAAMSRRVAWRNGRGSTDELAMWPPGSSFERADFDGRISKARIEEDGPFSAFPGFERILVVTDGAGLVLIHGDDRRTRLRALEPYRFDGALETRAELTAGAVSDFNVFTRRGACRADVEALRLGLRRTRTSVGPGDAFVHVILGAALVRVPREEEPFELTGGESVWARGLTVEEEFEIAGLSAEAVVLVVRIDGRTTGSRFT